MPKQTKQLKVLDGYRGWASAEAWWPAGSVVEVDDSELVAYGDEMLTLAGYLLKYQGTRFEEVKPKRKRAEEE